jgi:putative transposase
MEYWITNNLAMDGLTRLMLAERAWGIEKYHRGLKQCAGAGRSKVGMSRARRVHMGCVIRAFVRLERRRLTTGIGWIKV